MANISPEEIYELLKLPWVMDIVSIYLWKKVENLSIDNFMVLDDDIYVQLRYNTFPILSATPDHYLSKLVPIFKYIKQIKTGKPETLTDDLSETTIEHIQNRAISATGINERYLLDKIATLEKLLIEMKEIIVLLVDKLPNNQTADNLNIQEIPPKKQISKKEFITICEKISKKYAYIVHLIYLDDHYVCTFSRNSFTHKKYTSDVDLDDIIDDSFLLHQHDAVLIYIKPLNEKASSAVNIYDDMERILEDIKKFEKLTDKTVNY